MRQCTVLYRERAPARCTRATALRTHAAKGEGEGESNNVPHDDPEPLAACVQAHPPTHTRAKPRPSRPRRGYPEEPVGCQHRGLHGPQCPAEAPAPLRRADCAAANRLVKPLPPQVCIQAILVACA